MVQWDGMTQGLLITVKELLPILLAGILWGKSWRVLCLCDNQMGLLAFTPARADTRA